MEGFLALPVWGAYIWRGLFSEFYGILQSKLNIVSATRLSARSYFHNDSQEKKMEQRKTG